MSEAASIEPPASAVQSGLLLAQARQSCNLTIADVAHHLKLSPAQVEALEAGRFERLPGAVFARGFIRNYARLVKLDPEPLVAQIERPPVPEVTDVAAVPADIPFPSGSRVRWHKYAIGALLVVAVLVAFEFYAGSPETAPNTAVKQQPAEPQTVPDGVTTAAASRSGSEPGSSEPSVKMPAATSSLQAGASIIPAVTAGSAAEAERKAGEHELRLEFDRESWVEIRDRNGRKILSQLNRAGTTQSVSGLPPLTLVVGNAGGVRLTHNDRPVNLAPHTNVDVARLTLR